MEVSGQLQAPATLLPDKEPWYPLNLLFSGCQTWSGHFKETEIPWPCLVNTMTTYCQHPVPRRQTAPTHVRNNDNFLDNKFVTMGQNLGHYLTSEDHNYHYEYVCCYPYFLVSCRHLGSHYGL